jgi:hypothetical protein
MYGSIMILLGIYTFVGGLFWYEKGIAKRLFHNEEE